MTVERRDLTKDVAAALGVSAATIQRYAREGLIPFDVTLGGHRRFNTTEVGEVLRSMRVNFPNDIDTLMSYVGSVSEDFRDLVVLHLPLPVTVIRSVISAVEKVQDAHLVNGDDDGTIVIRGRYRPHE